LRPQFLEHRIGARAAGRRIRNDADLMTPRDLLACHIEHVPEQAAERGPQHMNDP
jgi:hypothetical protein